MKHNRTLSSGIKNLIDGMNAKQKANWRRLVQFMRAKDSGYDHTEFSDNDFSNKCGLSYAIAAGIVPERQPQHFSNYENATDEIFGEGTHELIFGGDSYPDEDLSASDEHGFADFCYYVMGIDNLEHNTNSAAVADALEAMFNLLDTDGKLVMVTVHWKSNQKDNFPSVEALSQFMELNPHRQKGYRKITATKLVERIVLDEVVETITL